MEPCSPGDGSTIARRWEAVNGFPGLFCLCVWLLPYLLNCFYLKPPVFSLLPFLFSPPSHRGGASERLSGAQLPAGVKPRHPLMMQISAHQNHSDPLCSKQPLLLQPSRNSCRLKLKLRIIFRPFWILRHCLYFIFQIPCITLYLTAKLSVTKSKITK